MQQGGGAPSEQVVEEASPISSRPPAANIEELMRFSAEEGGGGGGGGCSGSSSGNRWPSEETLALLRIRSEMDATFRDATVKGPLWEDVSRKLEELGYKRSAKKCKEKFENVHKYYKRTKEGRSGRQDGKTYKFFSQLEALTASTATPPQPPTVTAATSTCLDVSPLSVGIPPSNPIHISPHRINANPAPPATQPLAALGMTSSQYIHSTAAANAPAATSFGFAPMTTAAPPPALPATSLGINFSSDSSSMASSSGYDDHEMEEIEPCSAPGTSSHKRKRHPTKGGGSRKMMEFFENLTRQVMQKQEAMQRSFLEAIEKREHERLNREEAWKRQEMARLAREHDLMAQERAASASRDAAIVSYIQRITGQTIQLPPPVTVSSSLTTPLAFQPQPAAVARPAAIATPVPHHPPQRSHQEPSSAPVMAIPEQQIPPPQRRPQEQQQDVGASGSSETASSRWPKPEVLALINLRSGLESKYQEAGPKAPLWEDISTGMKRMGYNRSAKRCKEKWENINKYFKKVKESNKKRPEDAKTCPYFHQLDALYRKKVLTGSSSVTAQLRPQQEEPSTQHHQESVKADPGHAVNPPDETGGVPAQTLASETENKAGMEESSPGGSLLGEENQGAAKKPEDLVRVPMEQKGMPTQENLQEQQPLMVDDYDKIDGLHSYNLDDQEEDDEEDEDEDEDEEMDEDGKIAYKIEFQQRNASASNREGNSGAPSFLTMVQ